MAENSNWSITIGRWGNVPVRLHLLLVLFVAGTIGLELSFSTSNIEIGAGTGVVTVLVLLVSIWIHEMAHVFALMNLGGRVEQLVLMPWGGNSQWVLPPTKNARGIVALAGPFANGVLFLLMATLLLKSENRTFFELINPFRPQEFFLDRWEWSLVSIVAWINFQLMWINLIPCFPFDGAEVVRSLIAMLNQDLPLVRAESAVMVIGDAVAFTLFGLSWLARSYDPGPLQLEWMIPMLGGVTLFFAARYAFQQRTQHYESEWEDPDDLESFYEEIGLYEPYESYEEVDADISQWLNEKREAREHTMQLLEEEEDRRADDILKKLHDGGLASLTEEERSVLERVSARIRKRRETEV